MMPAVAEQRRRQPLSTDRREAPSRTGAGAAPAGGNFALCAVGPVARRHGGVPSGEVP